ncbi:MAG: biotin--[acetyl-CoA-carboxylase] ligase [Spirochaetales bacterium]|nr:biotin--[acetyl-CoA-carboxylase] ligase [Spirochaetales bacterium]
MEVLLVNNPWPEASVYYIESTTSTMDLAYDLINQGVVTGTVIMAGYQTKGRGRFSMRRWESLEKQNLLFTLIIKNQDMPQNPSLTPLLAGYSLRAMLSEKYKIETQIKWPNDVLFESKKLAGILCEARSGYILVGIGLNCNQMEFPPMDRIIPTSLKLIAHRDFSLSQLLADFLHHGHGIFHQGFDAELFNRHLYQRNQEILFDTGKKQIKGILLGLSPDGGILIQQHEADEPQAFYAGEILY